MPQKPIRSSQNSPQPFVHDSLVVQLVWQPTIHREAARRKTQSILDMKTQLMYAGKHSGSGAWLTAVLSEALGHRRNCLQHAGAVREQRTTHRCREESRRRTGLWGVDLKLALSQKLGSICDRKDMTTDVQPIDARILRSLRAAKCGSVLSPKHFSAFGNPAAVRKALSRLVTDGKIRRVRQGLYDLPRQHPIIGQTVPDIMATVRSLMEGSHAQWQFSGAYAANALGLSDQVPAKIVIYTNGLPRRVALGKMTLVFRRAAPRNLLGAGRPAGLVIQALRYLHSSPDMQRHIAHLRKQLDAEAKHELKTLTPELPAWLQPIVEQIVQS